MPEEIGTLVEVAHGQVGKDGVILGWAALPDGAVAKETAIAPGITLGQLGLGHQARFEEYMAGVVEVPVLVKEAAIGFHFGKQRRAGIGGENVEGGALEMSLFDPVYGFREDLGAIVVKAEHEAAGDLYADGVEDGNAPGVVGTQAGALGGRWRQVCSGAHLGCGGRVNVRVLCGIVNCGSGPSGESSMVRLV